MQRVGLAPAAVVLALAALGAFLGGQAYLLARRDRSLGLGLYTTAPLLGLTIAAILLTVQFSLPLSLGLLAALTLVRLRVPVKEPEEISLVLLIVAVAVAAAAFKIAFLGGLLLAALAAAALMGALWARTPPPGHLRLTIDLASADIARHGAALDLDSLVVGAELRRWSSSPESLRVEFTLPALGDTERQALVDALGTRMPGARVAVCAIPAASE